MGNIQDKLNEAKAWYQSRTIVGVIIGIIPTFVKLVFDVDVDVDAGVDVIFSGGAEIAALADGIYGMVMEIIGASIAIWGRLVATVKIK